MYTRSRGLGAGCIPGVAGDVSKASVEVKAKTNLARSIYQEHFNWFRANASKLDASNRSHFAGILQGEIALLQPMEGALFALESYGRDCGLSGYRQRGLGILPAVYGGIALSKLAIGVLLAIGVTAVLVYSFAQFQDKANEAERLRQAAAIDDKVFSGEITPEQGAAMKRGIPKKPGNPEETSIPWGLIALVAVGGIATYVALK